MWGPSVPKDVGDLIRLMSRANPTWGAPRIHGELLKLGMHIGETSVSKYLDRHRKPPSQAWRTFLENHVKNLVSVDFFTVPTLRFQVLYVFLVLAHERRRILHFGVTAHPTAEWTATTPRCLPLGHRATLSSTGSRPHLRRRLQQAGSGYGHPGTPGATVTLATSLRGTR